MVHPPVLWHLVYTTNETLKKKKNDMWFCSYILTYNLVCVVWQESDPDEDFEDSGAECVICMSDMRDTLILPCRHLCLCSACAESLRYQASMCPICRVKFRALLQIRAMRRKVPPVTGQQVSRVEWRRWWWWWWWWWWWCWCEMIGGGTWMSGMERCVSVLKVAGLSCSKGSTSTWWLCLCVFIFTVGTFTFRIHTDNIFYELPAV
jgi:hypothetical protein